MNRKNQLGLWLVLILITACSAPKPFLEQYDTHVQWISEIGNQSSHTFRGIDVDRSDNLYISGITFGTVNVCDTTYRGNHSGLLMKVGKDLHCRWSSFFHAVGDRGVCFLLAPVVDRDGQLMVPGICSGALFFNGVRQFDATGRMQSFIMKMDTASHQTWIMRYFTDENFILTQIVPLSNGRILVAGIKSENINKLFEIDLTGSIDSSTIREYIDPAKVYTSTVLVRGGKRYLSAIGVRHVSLRELDGTGEADWTFIEDTHSDLLAVKATIGVDYQKGLWISIPFNSGAEPFVFGRDTLTGGGLIDSYVTQFRGRKQHHSMHITGAADQIVTGLFDSHNSGMSLALSHGDDFLIDSLSYTGSPGISLLEFYSSQPKKMTFSTFPIENKERDRMTNSGIFFRHHAGRDAYLGGFVIKGEFQTTDPLLTVGDESLVVRRPVFNSFLVRGRKKG